MGNICCVPEAIDYSLPVNLFHFELLRAIGKGTFSKVRIVRHRLSDESYALKYVNKEKCVRMKAVTNILQERRLLGEIENPFIVNMRYAFQDDENLFMVLDLMQGGDLRFHIDRQSPSHPTIDESVVRFWIAELAIALDYLHGKNIVHRDLKPDNVLLDSEGHAHLTDFNIAMRFDERKPMTGVAGSIAYMAPEILSSARKGYLHTVDYWSLGVVAFEASFGKRPFKGKSTSSLQSAILNETVVVPENTAFSKDAVDCVLALLERDIKKRLGCSEGIEDFKRHPWFKDIDWEKLEKKECIAPFIPDQKRANNDGTHELEELLLEDHPLKARKRNSTVDPTTLSPEMRRMEEYFRVYDFSKMKRKSVFLDPTQTQFSQTVSTPSAIVALEDQPESGMIDASTSSRIFRGSSSQINEDAAQLQYYPSFSQTTLDRERTRSVHSEKLPTTPPSPPNIKNNSLHPRAV